MRMAQPHIGTPRSENKREPLAVSLQMCILGTERSDHPRRVSARILKMWRCAEQKASGASVDVWSARVAEMQNERRKESERHKRTLFDRKDVL